MRPRFQSIRNRDKERGKCGGGDRTLLILIMSQALCTNRPHRIVDNPIRATDLPAVLRGSSDPDRVVGSIRHSRWTLTSDSEPIRGFAKLPNLPSTLLVEKSYKTSFSTTCWSKRGWNNLISALRLSDVSQPFGWLSPTSEQVLVYYSPVRH